MSFDIDLILDSIPKMLMGIGLTFELLFLSLVLGTVLGIFLLILRISGRWYLAAPTMVYIYIFRGTPFWCRFSLFITACHNWSLFATVFSGRF